VNATLGSDSTSGALTFAFYYLLTNKSTLKSLIQELDETFEDCDKSNLSLETLTSLPYLNAVINESLRLGTPLPELPRIVPKEGAVISGKFIPGSTIVGINARAQMTSEENFYPDPEAFRPERWLPGGLGPESRARKGAMISFSFGAFSCLGKGLVLQEMRLVLAHVLLKYNLEFAPEWDRQKFEDGIDNMRTTIFNYPLLATLKSRY
jgi:cytochrome P450